MAIYLHSNIVVYRYNFGLQYALWENINIRKKKQAPRRWGSLSRQSPTRPWAASADNGLQSACIQSEFLYAAWMTMSGRGGKDRTLSIRSPTKDSSCELVLGRQGEGITPPLVDTVPSERSSCIPELVRGLYYYISIFLY